MSEELTQKLPDDSTILQQVLTELRALRGEVRALDAHVANVETTLNARSRETQPMSERVDQLLAEVAATRHEMREVNRTMRRINVDIATALRNQDDLEDRVLTLEENFEQRT